MMREPLTSPLLTELIEKLHVAFPRNIGKQNPAMMVDVYRNGLRGVGGDSVREAVERLIQTEQYFPKVAQIREAAMAYDRQRTVTARVSNDPDECGVCGARVKEVPCYRTTDAIGEDGQKVREYIGSRLNMTHDPRMHGIRENQETA